jgi:DHA1 family tetracycline resistance protein-like MFS transporter
MKGRKTNLFIIFLTVFIDLLGFGIIIPIVPFYLESNFVSPENAGKVLGLLITSFSAMQFLFAPILGRISDKIGRRPVILGSLFASGITHFIFALAPNLTILFIARLLTGIAAATVPTAMAYIADITTPENRAKGMGLIGMSFGLGFVFGPAIGGVLSHQDILLTLTSPLRTLFSETFIQQNLLRIPIFFAGILSFSSFLFAFFKLGESLKAKGTAKGDYSRFQLGRVLAALKHPRLGLLFTIFFVVTLAFTSLETIFAYLVERRFQFSSSQTGMMFAYIGIISATIQGGLIGRLAKKFGEQRLLIFSVALLSVTFFLIPFMTSFGSFLATLGFLSVAIGLTNPSVISLVSKTALPEEQGGVLGMNQSFSALSRIIGPFFAGTLFDLYGIRVPFWISSVFLAVAFLLTLKLYKQIQTLQSSNQQVTGHA